MPGDESDSEFHEGGPSGTNHPRSDSDYTSPITTDRRTVLAAGVAAFSLPSIGQIATGTITDRAYEPLGQLDFDDAREVVVDAAGEVAYVAANTHVTAVDVSDPANPTSLSQVQIGTDHFYRAVRGMNDVKVDGDRLITGGPGGYADDYAGFGVVDVSDPSNMREVAFAETSPDHGIHNCYLDGDHAYLTGTNSPNGGQSKLRIYDIGNDDPEEIATWYPGDHDSGWNDVAPLLRNLHDVYVQDGTAYLSYWDAGVFLVDVSDPSSPEHIARFGDHTMEELQEITQSGVNSELTGPPGNAHYTAVNDDGTILGEGGESWAAAVGDDTGPSGITLYDISDPANPEELSTIAPEETGNNTQSGYWSTSHNFEIRGDKLYSSWYNAGVKIHDISDPSSPEQVAWYAEPNRMSFWTAQVGVPDEFFVTTTYLRGPNTGDSALYTFPDEPGEMAESPEFPPLQDDESEATTMPASDDQTTTEATEPGPTTTEQTTVASETQAGTESTTGGGTTSGDDSSDGGAPGLGVLSALAGVGIGAWRLRNRSND